METIWITIALIKPKNHLPNSKQRQRFGTTNNRKEFTTMKEIIAIIAMGAILLLTGCNTANTLAKGVSEKSISASGVFTLNRAGLDKTTQTPELLNLFIWGDYASVHPGDEIFRYEEAEDASIFNSKSVNKNKKIFFATGDKKRMDTVINSIVNK